MRAGGTSACGNLKGLRAQQVVHQHASNPVSMWASYLWIVGAESRCDQACSTGQASRSGGRLFTLSEEGVYLARAVRPVGGSLSRALLHLGISRKLRLAPYLNGSHTSSHSRRAIRPLTSSSLFLFRSLPLANFRRAAAPLGVDYLDLNQAYPKIKGLC
ncbi:hypothetical protein BX600DRAFT_443516 [Xylariales sp. PMI_506]|nr:hypothetical protein BX600DRAFT_443516 [Xylariales sp. PMI_506]